MSDTNEWWAENSWEQWRRGQKRKYAQQPAEWASSPWSQAQPAASTPQSGSSWSTSGRWQPAASASSPLPPPPRGSYAQPPAASAHWQQGNAPAVARPEMMHGIPSDLGGEEWSTSSSTMSEPELTASTTAVSAPEAVTASTTAVSAPEAEPPLQAPDAVVLAPRWGWPYNWPPPACFGGTASSPPRFGGTPGVPPWKTTVDTSQAPLGEPDCDGWTCCGPHAEDPPWAKSAPSTDVELPPIDSHLRPAASAELGDVELPPIGQRAAAASTGCTISAPPLPGAESAASFGVAPPERNSRTGVMVFNTHGVTRRWGNFARGHHCQGYESD